MANYSENQVAILPSQQKEHPDLVNPSDLNIGDTVTLNNGSVLYWGGYSLTTAQNYPAQVQSYNQNAGLNTASSSSGMHIEMPDYSKYYERLAELSAEANAIAERQVAVGETMLQISQEQYDWWKTNYQPHEQALIDQAKRGIDATYAAKLAGNRIGLAFEAQRGATDRFYERLGTNTSSERLARIRDDISLQKAAAEVNARNRARSAAADASKRMTTAVAALGRGAAAESLDAFGNGAQTLAQAAATKNDGASTLASVVRSANALAADAAGNYYDHLYDERQASAQRDYMRDLSQIRYDEWLYGTVGNTVGTLAGAAAGYYAGGGWRGAQQPAAPSVQGSDPVGVSGAMRNRPQMVAPLV